MLLKDALHKLPRDFEIQTDYIIPVGRQNRLIINKKKRKIYRSADFIVQANQRVKIKENEKGDMYLDLAREHEGDDYISFNWYTLNNLQRLGKEGGELEIGEQIKTIQSLLILARRVLST